ncbi:iron uptake transporter permease EfeU [Paracoccus contaminans]|uniref:Iron transporter n=1 Tax=Paracoccus contaminans TaxID=1945662 RepID=A0A1W6CYK0_9RHOB|nr:iron uptake transporter permease EfeU [Paracoccus contaminans]ARJ69947.1 iron transporter [Paracoccus contaminans]
MLVAFLIMFREGVEAALIVGIIAAYLGRTGRAAWLPAVWVGVLLAVALSLFAGAALQLASAEFPQRMQELFEAALGAVAVVVLMSMVIWMRRAARSVRGTLEGGVERAFASAGATWALIGTTFLAVAREGLEAVFFLLALFQQSPGPSVPLSALAGLAVAAVAGVGLYRGSVRLDLARFFRWTGVLVIVVAAGLAATVLRSLHEAGIWNHLQQTAWDLGRLLPVSSVPGAILSGLFGYHDRPAVGEVMLWAAVLIPSLWLFLRPQDEPRSGRRAVH